MAKTLSPDTLYQNKREKDSTPLVGQKQPPPLMGRRRMQERAEHFQLAAMPAACTTGLDQRSRASMVAGLFETPRFPA